MTKSGKCLRYWLPFHENPNQGDSNSQRYSRNTPYKWTCTLARKYPSWAPAGYR